MSKILPPVIAFRLLLAAAVVAVLGGALTPMAHYMPATNIWDKANHFTAFACLAVLSKLAFPTILARYLALMLLALGISIEIVQAIPALHRSAEFGDILADIAGIAAGFAFTSLLGLAAGQMRRRRSHAAMQSVAASER